MRGLRLHLTPFAPDQSGATSALFELGGIVVVVDAGGCTGNICGFDEPRWHTTRSAVFSAGLRDMDAIMGRDDKLVSDLVSATAVIDATFCAIVGTPVPAVIGTDLAALARMPERAWGVPTIAVEANGCELYDKGADRATTALFRRFATQAHEVEPGRVGIIGASPLELSVTSAQEIARLVPGAVVFGMGGTLEDVCRASSCERNLVVSPSGLRAARLLERRFSTPFEIGDPRAARVADEVCRDHDVEGAKILVVAQQVSANSLRDELYLRGAAGVRCATWFALERSLASDGDLRLTEEDDLEELVAEGGFDLVVCDETLACVFSATQVPVFDLPQFAVSGRLQEVGCGTR